MALYNKVVTPSQVLCNDLVSIDDEWTVASTGNLAIVHNQTSKVALVKLNAPVGARLIKVISHLGISAEGSSNKTTIAVSIRKVVNKADGVTDTEVKAVTAVEYEANAKADIVADCDEVVAENVSYYARITATTANNAGCKAALIGATAVYQ